MSIGNTTRTPAGSEPHIMLVLDDVIQSVSGAMTEVVGFTGHPASFLQVTPTNGVNTAAVGTGADFPAQNATLPTQSGVDFTHIKLDAGLTSVDVIGMMIVIISGTGLGIARIITGFSSLLAQVALMPVQPAAGDGYLILIPTHRLSRIMVKGEFDTAKATAPTALVEVALFDVPPTTGAGATLKYTRAPIRYADIDVNIDNKNHQSGPVIGGYYHGRVRTVDCSGSLGAKIRCVSAPSTGKIALWGAGV